MAFPASPSNNDVHKEGNRSWVYDSALGTWDQLRESDEIDTIGGGTHKVLTNEDTFPSGHVLQMQRGYYRGQSIMVLGPYKLIDLSITARGNNSRWYGQWYAGFGEYLDTNGWNAYATISTAAPVYNSGSQVWSGIRSGNALTQISGNDLGNFSGTHGTQYSFGTHSGDLDTDQEGSTGRNFAKGSKVRCTFWVKGNATTYVNRSYDRGSEHESSVTALTVWEIAK